jgi:hypothetical protein
MLITHLIFWSTITNRWLSVTQSATQGRVKHADEPKSKMGLKIQYSEEILRELNEQISVLNRPCANQTGKLIAQQVAMFHPMKLE